MAIALSLSLTETLPPEPSVRTEIALIGKPETCFQHILLFIIVKGHGRYNDLL